MRFQGIVNFGLLLGCAAICGVATAAALPKGDCADPQPFTDLRGCRFKGADLRNRDLRGTDMSGILFYKTQLQGANLKDALFDGRYISYANLDGVIGLPSESLAVLKHSYLVTPNDKGGYSLSQLPSDYKGSNENIAGLDNVFMAQTAESTQHTIALLAYPKYGDGQISAILTQFQNGRFEFPTCYQSINLLNDGKYYYPRWNSMKVKPLPNGDYLLAVLAAGSDGDDMGVGGWEMLAFLKISSTCAISLLHKEDSEWAENPDKTGCRGTHLNYHFLDNKAAEITMTAHTCKASSAGTHKTINFNVP